MTRLKRTKDLPSDHKNDVRFGTPQEVAEYRAERLCKDVDTLIEVGAGAGFQTAEFAKRAKKVIAIDIDEERLQRGNFPDNVTPIAGDALQLIDKIKPLVTGKTIVFLDPERPPSAKERILSEIQPNISEFIARYSDITEDIAIELPPFLEEIPFQCEKEYLSINFQLNRLTIYLGGLKRSEVSVVQLPLGNRVEHSGRIPELLLKETTQKYLLEPDRALVQSKLTPILLPDCAEVPIGNKPIYAVDNIPEDSFFKVYETLIQGSKQDVIDALQLLCGKLILHGKLTQEAQSDLLRELNKYCVGNETLHLFLADKWYLARRKQ